jgi:hypothetical protein
VVRFLYQAPEKPLFSLILVTMKKLVAIAVISIYVISFTEIHQFLKLPMLWKHYTEHRQKDNSITFLEYLSHHYNTHSDHHDDHDRDMELPFKDFGHCSSVPAVTLPTFKIDLKVSLFDFEKAYVSFYKKFVTPFHLTEIWQPPRI